MGPKTRDTSLILPAIESTNLPQVESHSSISRCASAPPDPQLARAIMTFTCRVHGMTSSLTQQTFGGGGGEGDHVKFSQTEGG